MNPAADLGGMFIVPDVNVCASVQIINMGHKGPWETNWISIEFKGRLTVGFRQVQKVRISLSNNSDF